MTTYPYEIHLTIAETIPGVDFATTCKLLGMKPIFLELHRKDGGVGRDIMTSSTISSPSRHYARIQMRHQAEELRLVGYNVIRGKIETVPWNPEVPSSATQSMTENQYFESHIKVIVSPDNDFEELRYGVGLYGAHLSNSEFKKGVHMVTLRADSGTRQNFESKVASLRQAITDAKFEVSGNTEIEFCVFDSKKSHDDAWMGS